MNIPDSILINIEGISDGILRDIYDEYSWWYGGYFRLIYLMIWCFYMCIGWSDEQYRDGDRRYVRWDKMGLIRWDNVSELRHLDDLIM